MPISSDGGAAAPGGLQGLIPIDCRGVPVNRILVVPMSAVFLLFCSAGFLRAQTADEVKDLRKQIQDLEQVITSLKQKVDAMEKRQASPAVAAALQPLATEVSPPPSPAVDIPPLSRRETSRRDAESVARIGNAPITPSKIGYISIPGTESSFKIGGYAKMDAIVDLRLAGDPDQFRTSSIPINAPSGLETSSFNLHVRQTRFNVDIRRPGPRGDTRVFVEADFFGSGGATAFRMRHAYGQAHNLLVGWTWSTLVDVDAFPDSLDNMGSNGLSKTRQPQVRYTLPLKRGNSLAFGVEKSSSEISIDGVTNVTRFPDLIARYRHENKLGHVQLGTVFRQIGGASQSLNSTLTVFGWGVKLSGGIKLFEKDSFVFETEYGDGMAHYIDVISGLGLDAAPRNSQTPLAALPAFGGDGGYQHRWSKTLRSTVAYGFAQVMNFPGNKANAFHKAHYVSGNLIWRPVKTGEVGFEYLMGEHMQKDGASATASRLQFSLKYDLIY